MAIIASAKGNASPISEGVHVGGCIWVIDLGTQYSDYYKNSRRRIMLTWEVFDETIDVDGEEKPRVISKEYTLSLSDKAILRRDLEAWRGRKFTEQELESFDLGNILGANCQMQIIHNDKGYANVASIMSLPKGMPLKQTENEEIYFDLTEERSLDLMDKLPDWINTKIKQSPEYNALTNKNFDKVGDVEEIDAGEEGLPF